MNLGEVKTQFLALLNNTRCTPTLVTAFIDAGLGRCQRELRCPAMERACRSQSAPTTTASGFPVIISRLFALKTAMAENWFVSHWTT